MIFELDDRQVADNTVLLFGIRYVDPETYGSRGLKVFTYAALKAGGRWYFTGTGRVPQDAGWGAVKRWLDDPRREVVWVKVATKLEPLWERVDQSEVRELFGSRVAGNLADDIPAEPGPARDAWLRTRGWDSYEHWQSRGE